MKLTFSVFSLYHPGYGIWFYYEGKNYTRESGCHQIKIEAQQACCPLIYIIMG